MRTLEITLPKRTDAEEVSDRLLVFMRHEADEATRRARLREDRPESTQPGLAEQYRADARAWEAMASSVRVKGKA